MREWVSSLGTARLPEFALAIALGTALASLAGSFAHVGVGVLLEYAAHVPSDAGEGAEDLLFAFPSASLLNFEVGGTVIVYGPLLQATLAFGLVLLAAFLVVRRRDRVLGACPHCASRIPHESTHCAYCGSTVAPDTTS
jgi:hypothetical protein